MVSSGQQQANALLVSSPVILSSTASHLTPTSNVISSIATQPTNLNHPQQSFLQFFQNQQHRPPFLYSQQPQMLQLPEQKTNLKQAIINNPQQTLLIGNVPNLQQQQFLVNKARQIMFSQQTANSLQPRSQLLPNLQHQSPILNPQFLSSIPFGWTPNNLMTHNPIFLRPQQLNNSSDEPTPLFLHTPANHQTLQTSTPIYLQQNNGTVQLVQSTATASSINHNELDKKSITNNDIIKKELNNLSPSKTTNKEKTTILKYRKLIGDKMLNNLSTKKSQNSNISLRNNSRMIIQKSTQQMNEQLNNNTNQLNHHLKQKKR